MGGVRACRTVLHFGDAIYQVCDFSPEYLFDVFLRDVVIVFDHVMQQTGCYGGGVHAHVGQNARHGGYMHEIRLTGFTLLRTVCFLGKVIGFFNHLKF